MRNSTDETRDQAYIRVAAEQVRSAITHLELCETQNGLVSVINHLKSLEGWLYGERSARFPRVDTAEPDGDTAPDVTP